MFTALSSSRFNQRLKQKAPCANGPGGFFYACDFAARVRLGVHRNHGHFPITSLKLFALPIAENGCLVKTYLLKYVLNPLLGCESQTAVRYQSLVIKLKGMPKVHVFTVTQKAASHLTHFTLLSRP